MSGYLSIAPRALGTGASEALSSYVVRLAGAHVVPVRVFVHSVFPEVLRGTGLVPRNLLARRRAVWMNGNGRWAEVLSEGLGCLVRRRDLSLLTMAAFTDVLAAPRVLADTKRWCATCYASMRERGGECWDPLAWSLSPVRVCPEHGVALRERCALCNRLQPWLPRDTTVGWCAWCGEDLASSGALEGARSCVCPDQVFGVDPYRAARACAVLVARASAGEAVGVRAEFGRRIAALIDEVDEGNRSAFARRCRVSNMTPTNWVRSGVVRFDHAVCLAEVCGVPFADLLLELPDWSCPDYAESRILGAIPSSD